MNIVQLIQDFESSDNGTRTTAEGQLREAIDKDPEILALACSQELTKKDLTDVLRQRVCNFLENTLLHSITDTGDGWKSFDIETRQQIKSNLFETMTCPNDEIREITTNMISLIFAAECRVGEWPDFINTLIEAHQNIDAKKSAILTLGKACNQLKKRESILDIDLAELIWNGILQGMQEDETDDTVKLITAKALDMSLTLVKLVFRHEIVREKTWKFLLSMANSENRETKISALQCLNNYDVIGYNNTILRSFAEVLLKVTSISIAGKDQEIAILTIDILDSLAKEERQKEKEEEREGKDPEMKLTPQVGQMLVPILLENLVEICKSENPGSNMIDSIQSCLTSLARIMKDTFLQHSLVFIQGYLFSQNPGELRASLLAFSCLPDGSNQQSLSEIISQGIPAILKILMENKNLIVQEAASRALLRVAQEMVEVYFQEPLFSKVAEDLAAAINMHPRVSVSVVRLWERFGSHIYSLTRRNQGFLYDLTIVIDALVKNGFRDFKEEEEDEEVNKQVIDYTFPAAASLLRCISKIEVKNQYIQDLLQQLQKTRDMNGIRKELAQGGLLLCLEVLVQKNKFEGGNKIAEEIFKTLDDVSQSSDLFLSGMGLGVLSALISALGRDVKPYFKGCWLWITQALSRSGDFGFFHDGLDAAISLIETCPDEMSGNLQDIFTVLVTLLDKPEHNKHSKLRIITAIGDIALSCSQLILPYVETLNRVYVASMSAAVYNPPEKNPELTEYLEHLRGVLMDSYTCFFHSVSDTDQPDLILASIPSVMEFLAISCSQNYHPTPAYLRTALALITDIGLIFRDRVRQHIKSNLTVYLIESLSKFTDDPENATIIDYARTVLRDF